MYWLVMGVMNFWQAGTGYCLRLCPCTGLVEKDWGSTLVMATRARSQAEAIFLGTVIAADTLSRDSSWVGAESSSSRRVYVTPATIQYRFSVERSWKGKVGAETVIMSYGVNTSCGRDYRVGDLYLVYAERDREAPPGLMTYSCSRVKPEGNLKDDLRILGPGRAVKGERGGA